MTIITTSVYNWHVFVRFAPTPMAKRICSLGVQISSLYTAFGTVEACYKIPTECGASIGFQTLSDAQAFTFALGAIFSISDETAGPFDTMGEDDVIRVTEEGYVRTTMDGTPRALAQGLPVNSIDVRQTMDLKVRTTMNGDFRVTKAQPGVIIGEAQLDWAIIGNPLAAVMHTGD